MQSYSGTYTILVVDDEELNFSYIELVLRKFGYRVLYAADGSKAIDSYKENPDIDLVLMDLMMPGFDGMQTTQLLLQINPDLPVIAITAYASNESFEKAINSGCVEVLGKPFDKTLLISRIHHYLFQQ